MFGSKCINATVFPFRNHNTIQLHSLGTRIPNTPGERQHSPSADATFCKKQNKKTKPKTSHFINLQWPLMQRRVRCNWSFTFIQHFHLSLWGLMQEAALRTRVVPSVSVNTLPRGDLLGTCCRDVQTGARVRIWVYSHQKPNLQTCACAPRIIMNGLDTHLLILTPNGVTSVKKKKKKTIKKCTCDHNG